MNVRIHYLALVTFERQEIEYGDLEDATVLYRDDGWVWITTKHNDGMMSYERVCPSDMLVGVFVDYDNGGDDVSPVPDTVPPEWVSS